MNHVCCSLARSLQFKVNSYKHGGNYSISKPHPLEKCPHVGSPESFPQNFQVANFSTTIPDHPSTSSFGCARSHGLRPKSHRFITSPEASQFSPWWFNRGVEHTKAANQKKASNKKMRIWLELKWVATVWWTKMRVHKGTCLTRTSNTITDWRWFSMFGKGSQLEDTFKTWWSNQRKAASLRPATKIWRGDRVFPGPS